MNDTLQKRSIISLYIASIGKRIEKALTTVLRQETLKVDVLNQKDYQQVLNKINSSILTAQSALSSEIKTASDRKKVIDSLQGVRDAIESIPSPDFSELTSSLKEVEKAIGNIIIPEVSNENVVKELASIKKVLDQLPKQFPKPEKIEIPKPEKFPTQISIAESRAILTSLADLKTEIGKLPRVFPKEKPVKIDLDPLIEQISAVEKAVKNIPEPQEIDFPTTVSVDNFPPTRIPTPVTSVWINSLRGPILSTQVDVGASATQIPASNLEQRRSMIIFNNDSTKTVYIGDQNVNTSDGMPVFSKQYSPSLDIGDNVDVYAITSSGTVDVRILETSMDDQGA